MIRFTFHLKFDTILYLWFILTLLNPAWAVDRPPPFPPLQSQMLQDVSGTLSEDYLQTMTDKLSTYPFEIKGVFLPETGAIDLGQYAQKLFEHWEMSNSAMLLVVALDRRKIGVHMGSSLVASRQATQEIFLPSPSDSPVKKPSTPENPTPHLDLLPNIVADVLQEKKTSQTSSPPLETNHQSENMVDEQQHPQSDTDSPRRSRNIPFSWGWLLIFVIASGTGVGSWFGFHWWKKRSKTRDIREKYRLSSQVVMGELDTSYQILDENLEQLMKLKNMTRNQVKDFLKLLLKQQEHLDEIYNSFDDMLEALDDPEKQIEAVHFFDQMDQSLEKTQQLNQQAQTVQANLQRIQEQNSAQLTHCQSRQNQVMIRIQEIRQLHRLKLLKLYRIFKQAQEHLAELEQNNRLDPMGTRKAIETWLHDLASLERDLNAIPHLWQQMTGYLYNTLNNISERLKIQSSPPENATILLQEAKTIYTATRQAIEQGDRERIDHGLQSLTAKIQELEMMV